MRKVLMIADTYYPDSRATIQIAQRIAEEMVNRKYEVSVLPLHLENKKFLTYPKEHKAVSILKIEEYRCERDLLDICKKLNNICYRIAVGLKRFLVKNPQKQGQKWNEYISPKIKQIRKTIYENPKKNIALLELSGAIRNCINEYQPDVVITVAVPFEIHICTKKAINNLPIKWVATNFDPYAYNEALSLRKRKKLYQLEYRVCKSASAVIMLTQFEKGYVGEKLSKIIRYAELPNIRPLYHSEKTGHIFNPNTINCAFIGNLYGERRNPSFLFDLFEKMSDTNIHLYIIGGLIGISQEEFASYSEMLGERLHYLGRVGQQEAVDAMFEADVLVNVGHSTSNQCPSKVLDYMCTGKPILHIAKRKDCSSLPYLEKYEDWHCVHESQRLDNASIGNVEEFIRTSKEKPQIDFNQVKEAFPECTIENYVDIIEASLM